MTKTNIVVIGAGFAGVAATKTLSHKLKKNNYTRLLEDGLSQMRFNTTYKKSSHVLKM